MSTHLYCVLPADEDADSGRCAVPRGLSGVAGGQVRALPVDHLVAWVSDVSRDSPVSIEGVQAHDAVVEAALDTGSTPVPARFGQRFTDDNACSAAIATRASSVESLLSDVQGFVEMTILITPSTRRMIRDLEPVMPEMADASVSEAGVGRKYLDSLRAREAATGAIGRATQELAGLISAATADFVRRSAEHDSVTPLPLRTISHLVARTDLPAYRASLSEVRSGTEFRFLVIGPRAPYSFCSLRPDDGAHGMNLAD